ncbi:MAG: hypothetical protein CFE32_05615 [Alphaproteobacteria bacterium PA3]|nr:MAG: hypothetical protein CFE32_05615 [Alphaproteobacteria bacterium PA3]
MPDLPPTFLPTSDLIVIGYPSPEKAEAARAEVLRVAKDFSIDVADALVAKADATGVVRFNQMADLWAIGASGGGLWGLLAGLLFLHPRLGTLIGSGEPAIAGALDEYGIEDTFLDRASALLMPGRAAFFLLIRATASDRMIQRLGPHAGVILRTPLDPEAENGLRRIVAPAPPCPSALTGSQQRSWSDRGQGPTRTGII